jgi:hypothetical protein
VFAFAVSVPVAFAARVLLDIGEALVFISVTWCLRGSRLSAARR